MRRLRFPLPVVSLILAALPVWAQAGGTSSSATNADQRLFLSFIEDATVVENQWWEGQVEFSEGDFVDVNIIRGIVAFQVADDVEVGGRVGFGDTDIPGGRGGSGATDLDLWGKYYFGQGSGSTEFAAGGVLTIPTGDDTAGLGVDSFGVSAFGTLRHGMEKVILSAHAALRLNGDARFLGGPELDGKVSASVGVGVIAPISDQLAFVGEIDLESKRFDGGDTDSRILGGLNWRVGNQGELRGAIALGLDDGAPDTQVLGGYAYRF